MQPDTYELAQSAYDRWQEVTENLALQIIAIDLLNSTESPIEHILTVFKLKTGFLPDGADRFDSVSKRVHERAISARDQDFAAQRAAALIAGCGVLEYSAKMLFVVRAEEDPDNVQGTSSRTFKISQREALSLSERDRMFVIADKLYQDAPGRSHFDRFSQYVKQVSPESWADFEQQCDVDARAKLNDAFRVRNRLVHHGGRLHANQQGQIVERELTADNFRGLMGGLGRVHRALHLIIPDGLI